MQPSGHCENWLKVTASLRVDHKDKIAAELVHELDADGKQLCVVKISDYSAPHSRENEDRIIKMNRMALVKDDDMNPRPVNPVHPVNPPHVLKLPLISQRGNVNEIIGKFSGPDQLRTAVNQLQSLLYAA